jgi:hypothetical protein
MNYGKDKCEILIAILKYVWKNGIERKKIKLTHKKRRKNRNK